jgi:hypothetical protein
MLLKFKTAMDNLKADQDNTLHFYFAEQDENGEPILLLGASAISLKEKSQHEGAGKRCTGEMAMDANGTTLRVTTKGAAPTTLAKGIKKVARTNQCPLEEVLINQDAGAETDEENALVVRMDALRPRYEEMLSATTIPAKAETLTALWARAEQALQNKDCSDATTILNKLEPVMESGHDLSVKGLVGSPHEQTQPQSADELRARLEALRPRVEAAKKIPVAWKLAMHQEKTNVLQAKQKADTKKGVSPQIPEDALKINTKVEAVTKKAAILDEVFTRAARAQRQGDLTTATTVVEKVEPVLKIVEHLRRLIDEELGRRRSPFHEQVADRCTNDAELKNLMQERAKAESVLKSRIEVVAQELAQKRADFDKEQHGNPTPASAEARKVFEESLRKKREEDLKEPSASLAAINRMIDARLMQQGSAPKAMSPEYAGEDQKMGWRVGDKPQPPEPKAGESSAAFAARQQDYEGRLARWQKFSDAEMQVTKYYTEEEKQAARLHADEWGRVRDSADRLVSDKDLDYVLDEQGELYQGQRDVSRETGKTVENAIEGGLTQQKEYEHHSSVLGGAAVAGAGGVEFTKEGLIKRITNKSGHYKPGVTQMIQTVESLLRSGALVDKEWVYEDGRPLDGRARQIYEGILLLQDKIMVELAQNQDADVSKYENTVAKAKKMLEKMDCGPSNRFSKATVAFFELKDTMTGLDVMLRAQVGTTESVKEFLTGGAGYRIAPTEIKAELSKLKKKLAKLDPNDEYDRPERETIENRIKEIETTYPSQKQLKEDLLGQLREKTAATRTRRDDDAETRAQDVADNTPPKPREDAPPSKDDQEAMVDKLIRRAVELDRNALFTPDKMPAHFAEYDFEEYGMTATELADKRGIPLEQLWKDTKEEKAKELTDAEAVQAFEKRHGPVQDLLANVSAFKRMRLTEAPELRKLILKQFGLEEEKLDKWMGKGVTTFGKLFDKLNEIRKDPVPDVGMTRVLFLERLAEVEPPEFVDEVKAFVDNYGPLEDHLEDSDKFENIKIADSGLENLILKRFEPFGLTRDKLKKWMDKDRNFR